MNLIEKKKKTAKEVNRAKFEKKKRKEKIIE